MTAAALRQAAKLPSPERSLTGPRTSRGVFLPIDFDARDGLGTEPELCEEHAAERVVLQFIDCAECHSSSSPLVICSASAKETHTTYWPPELVSPRAAVQAHRPQHRQVTPLSSQMGCLRARGPPDGTTPA